MGLVEEIKDRMLHLEEENCQDGEEYEQLEQTLKGQMYVDNKDKPRFPVTEHIVTVYYDHGTRKSVMDFIESEGLEVLERRDGVHGHWILVRGIPNVLAGVEGVITIGWRTEQEHLDLLNSFEEYYRHKDAS